MKAINLSSGIIGLIMILLIIHVVKWFILSRMIDPQSMVGFWLIGQMSEWMLIPDRIFAASASDHYAAYASLITHALLHQDFTHLLTNIGFLAAFGGALSKQLSFRFWLLLLILSIIGGGLSYCFLTQDSNIPAIGISGGVSGMMGALLRPALLPTKNPIPIEGLLRYGNSAKSLLLFFIAFNLLSFFLSGGDSKLSSIAWQAHLGGFAIGFILYPWFWHLDVKTGGYRP